MTPDQPKPEPPGVDLDELDRLHAGAENAHATEKRLAAWRQRIWDTWPTVSAEIRTLRARVAELEAAVLRGDEDK